MMNNRTLVIAEAGVNHNGKLSLAKKLVDVASKAGADYIKFQTFKAKNIVDSSAKKANYQLKSSYNKDESQFKMLKRLELSESNHLKLIDYCNKRNIKFLSSAFDLEALKFLYSIDIDKIKIPSGEITNIQYLQKIADNKKDVIISTGMATMDEIRFALNILTSKNLTLNNITVLHCNSDYPTSPEQVNLRAMNHIKNELGVNIGYSDHTVGIETSLAAVALGAKVIEKHITLNRKLKGPDHAASLEPEDLIKMVKSIRIIEKNLIGSGIKEPSKSELKNIVAVRKSLFTNQKISKGTILEDKMIIALRPGNGISPIELPKLIGKKINVNLSKGIKLQEKHFEK